ncbi:MAG: energy transducer TonB [Candidatus Acidiferrum sp.]
MKRAWVVGLGLWMMAIAPSGQAQQPKYHGAGVSQTSGIAYPINAQQPGFVSLDALVSSNGLLQSIVVVRDVPPLTDAAQGAVKSWQFTAATLDGNGVPGLVRVNVVFNPYNPSGVGLPGESLQPPQAEVVSDFQPAGLVKANYAVYPPNTVVAGSVVLKIHVSAQGKVSNVAVLRGKDPLNAPSITAAKTWVFTPAMYKGKSVGSDVIVVFVYASPEAGTR